MTGKVASVWQEAGDVVAMIIVPGDGSVTVDRGTPGKPSIVTELGDVHYCARTPALNAQGQPKTPAVLKAELIADVQRQRAALAAKPASLGLTGQMAQV